MNIEHGFLFLVCMQTAPTSFLKLLWWARVFFIFIDAWRLVSVSTIHLFIYLFNIKWFFVSCIFLMFCLNWSHARSSKAYMKNAHSSFCLRMFFCMAWREREGERGRESTNLSGFRLSKSVDRLLLFFFATIRIKYFKQNTNKHQPNKKWYDMRTFVCDGTVFFRPIDFIFLFYLSIPLKFDYLYLDVDIYFIFFNESRRNWISTKKKTKLLRLH